MIIGDKHYADRGKTYIMGIINVTPDSFSDGGSSYSYEDALKRAERLEKEGADILDIGGESTRPGYTLISDEEEKRRIVPVIEAIKRNLNVPISVDTYKSSVAKAAIEVGADMVNDIWGLKNDKDMSELIASTGVSCCLMHNSRNSIYHDMMAEVIAGLRESAELALKSGIDRDRIMLDPGIGFAKSYDDNLELLSRLKDITALGYPVLLGASRKSVIGLTLKLEAEERLEGTLATTAAAVMAGCSFVRVHDVKENRRFITMLDAIYRHDAGLN